MHVWIPWLEVSNRLFQLQRTLSEIVKKEYSTFFIAVILGQLNRLEFQTPSVDCSTMTARPTLARIVISREMAVKNSSICR